MQCLYCGKELALLKRLTGNEFCSDAHKRSYQEEYNRLAVSRLLQAQPKADAPSKTLRRAERVAEAPEFFEGAKRALEAPRPPEPEPVPQMSQVVAEPEALPVAQTPEREPISVWREEPKAAPVPEPEPIPVEMAGFIPETPAIHDSELQAGLSFRGPAEMKGHTHYPSWSPVSQPALESLPMAALVGYESHAVVWPGEPPMVTPNAEVKEFSGAGPKIDVCAMPTPPKGLRSADKVRVVINARKAAETTCDWQSETSVFVFGVTFRDTTRSDSPVAGVGFPGDPIERAEASPPPANDHPVPVPVADGSPRAALQALSELQEELRVSPALPQENRNNGTQAAPAEAEPAVQTPAVEWLFSDRTGTRIADPKPLRIEHEEEPEHTPLPVDSPAEMEPAAAEAELAAVTAQPVAAVAVADPELDLPQTHEVAPETTKVPQFVTIPVKVFVPSKAKLAPGSQARSPQPTPELPRMHAQPLRPKMSLPAGAALENNDRTAEVASPETIEVPAPVSYQAPAEPAPIVASRPIFVKTPPAAVAPSDPVAPGGAPTEKALETKPGTWKTPANPKTEEQPLKSTAPAAKVEPLSSSGQGPEETEITIPGMSFATASSTSFWGALPLTAKVTIAAIVLVIVAAVVYLTSFSHKSMAAADGVGPSIIMGEGGWVTDWAGDSTGLHRGRQITIYKPSLKLSDYRISFQGRVENASIGWVFRAVDASNYYVMKLAETSSGYKLMKYAVVNGQEHEQGTVAVPASQSGWFSIRVDARGPKFNTVIDGQALDVWTDEQLKTGGVGFLNDRGERADIKGIAISYLAGGGK